MSRNSRIEIDRKLERYLDDLINEVNICLDDQERHEERDIRAISINADKCYTLAALVMEELYFNDGLSETKALRDAASIVVNGSIYMGLKRSGYLDVLTEDEEKDFEEDYHFITSIGGGGRGGRRDDRDRGRDRGAQRSGRDSRQDFSSGETRSRRDREEDPRDTATREQRERRDENSSAARRASRGQMAETARDNKVEEAQQNIDKNTSNLVTSEFVAQNPHYFCSEDKYLPLAPVYWLGSQKVVIIDNKLQIEKGENEVEYEKHRTDLYLKVRKSVAPSASIRDQALSQAILARDNFVKDEVKKNLLEVNAVTEKNETQFSQVLTSAEVAGQFYGAGTPLAKLNSVLPALGIRFLPDHPVITKIEQYPTWTMNKDLTEAVLELINCNDLNQLMPNLCKVMNEANPAQWAYFHDTITHLVNVALKVELEARPYLNSVLTEWNDFCQWLERPDNNTMLVWFKNNFGHFMQGYLHVYKQGSKLKHALVDGTDGNYASVSHTQTIVYLPADSENFGAASATRLGRVLESVTPKLYQLLSKNLAENTENILATSSDESVPVYTRASSLTTKVILMGDVRV